MVPKGFRKDIKLNRVDVGYERRQGLLDDISRKGTFLPRGVGYEDIDSSFINFVEKDLSITIDGDKVPVLFLTLQRWSEFSKSWQFADKYKDIKMPFITIVRQPNPQVGQNQAGLFNIPGRRTYTYMKVPTFEGGRRGVDVYKIPQPTSVDLNYEVRLFCNRMRDLNKLNQLVQRIFQSRQYYIGVNGHPMPVHLEGIGDESNIDDFENRRFYVQPYEMVVYGYIQDEEDYEVIPTVNRAMVMTELFDSADSVKFKVKTCKVDKTIVFNFLFKHAPSPSDNIDEFIFNSYYNSEFYKIDNLDNISNIEMFVNGNLIFSGIELTNNIEFKQNDTIKIKIYRINNTGNSYFTLNGNSI